MAQVTPSRTESFTLRVPSRLMAELRRIAMERGVSIAALSLEGMQQVVALPDVAASSKARLASADGDPRSVMALRSDRALRLIDPAVHHVSGPVLADPLPLLTGEAVGFNPKARWKLDARGSGKR